MIFDFTHGKEVKYMVMYYYWNGFDRVYYHTYKEAKEGFERAITQEHEEGTAISLYDIKKDIRKAYKRY